MPIVAFPLTIFLGAFLLFAVEPMMGKVLLPWFGGAPSVWTTCMLFFQLLLLGGYAYAHVIATALPPRAQASLHLMLAALCMASMTAAAIVWRSPLIPPADWKPASPEYPALGILAILFTAAGLPYFTLSATASLLQQWFAASRAGRSPYRLYALSNLGSMLGLAAYPFLLEPSLNLHQQAMLWYWLYVLFALGLALSALSLCGGGAVPVARAAASSPQPPIELGTQLMWVALAGCASLMFLAVTNQLCQDIAAVPFLWVLPLGIYLLSFVVCFGNESWYRRAIFNTALAVAIVASCAILYRPYTEIVWQAVIYSLLVGSSCTVCHGELVRLKPARGALTRFYLMVSAGGALGGLLSAVLAPWLFRGYWELHIAIWGCAALLFVALMRDPASWLHQPRPILAIGLLAGALALPELILAAAGNLTSALYYNLTAGWALMVVVGAILARRDRRRTEQKRGFAPVAAAAVLLMVASVLLSSITAKLNNSLISIRNFYGAAAVIERDAADPAWHAFVLRHGSIVHGVQYSEPDKRRQPTAYFGPTSGIGLLMLHHPRRISVDPRVRTVRVGVVGLGIGTIATYGRPGDYIRFYEINPAIIHLATARNGYFSYVRDSQARVDIVAGDARLSMEREVRDQNAQRFDILVIDAFSGDAIPVHLLTIQAFALYLRELNPDGVLALHISNNHLDLRPVAARLANHFGLRGGWIHSVAADRMTQPSDWVVLARGASVLAQPAIASQLRPLASDATVGLWSDDYSNLFRILR